MTKLSDIFEAIRREVINDAKDKARKEIEKVLRQFQNEISAKLLVSLNNIILKMDQIPGSYRKEISIILKDNRKVIDKLETDPSFCEEILLKNQN